MSILLASARMRMYALIQMDQKIWMLVCLVRMLVMCECSCLMIGFQLVILVVRGLWKTLMLCVDNLVLTLMVSHYMKEGFTIYDVTLQAL